MGATNELSGLCIDVRSIPGPQRHPTIFGTFDALPLGSHFEILNDHDPAPLRYQFENTRPGQYGWNYLQAGPAQWRVRISRVAEGVAQGVTGGCGGCGCHGG